MIAPGLYSHLFTDICVAFINDASNNDYYSYILVVVDGLSRQLFARPMFTKTANETKRNLENIFMNMDLPGTAFLVSDRGGEFGYGIWEMLDSWGIIPVFVSGRHKSSIAERAM